MGMEYAVQALQADPLDMAAQLNYRAESGWSLVQILGGPPWLAIWERDAATRKPVKAYISPSSDPRETATPAPTVQRIRPRLTAAQAAATQAAATAAAGVTREEQAPPAIIDGKLQALAEKYQRRYSG